MQPSVTEIIICVSICAPSCLVFHEVVAKCRALARSRHKPRRPVLDLVDRCWCGCPRTEGEVICDLCGTGLTHDAQEAALDQLKHEQRIHARHIAHVKSADPFPYPDSCTMCWYLKERSEHMVKCQRCQEHPDWECPGRP